MELKQGDILFSYGTSFVAEIIEDITKGSSHCAILSDSKGNIIESQGGRKVGYSDISRYSTNIRIYRLPISSFDMISGFTWLFQQQGKWYDYYDILVLTVWLLFKFKIPWKEYGSFICSRLVRDYLFNCKCNIPNTNMTPKDVEDWVIANGGVLIIDSVSRK